MQQNKSVLYQYTKKILVILIGEIEEVISATPFLQLMKETWTDKTIHVLVQPKTRPILINCPYVDDIRVFNDKWGLNERFRFLQGLEIDNYDLVVSLTPSFTSFAGAYLTKAPHRLGMHFTTPKYMSHISKFMLTDPVTVPLESKKIPHFVDICLGLAGSMGLETKTKDLFLQYTKDDDQMADKMIKELKWDIRDPKIHCIHVSEKWLTQGWDKNNFVRLTGEIKKAMPGANVLFIYESWELDIGREIAELYLKDQSIACISDRNVHQWASIIKRCKYIITPESSSVMIASSQKTPTIALYNPETFTVNSQLWGPWKVKNRKLMQKNSTQLCNEILGSIIELEKMY